MASKITNVDKLSELEDTTNHKHDFLLKKRPLTKILKKSFIKQILKKKSTRKKLLFSRKKSKIALKKQEAKLQLKNRIEKSQGELTIKDSIVFIKIYDHIKLDGDSVSVFYNNKLILLKYGLVAYKQSKFYKLIINPKASKSKIVIIAESVGKTPPNSATMEIYNSKNKLLFKKIVESDFKNNVVIDLLHDTKIFKQNIKK